MLSKNAIEQYNSRNNLNFQQAFLEQPRTITLDSGL